MMRFAGNEYKEKAGSEQNVGGGAYFKIRELKKTNFLEQGTLQIKLEVGEVHGVDHVDCMDAIRSQMRKSQGVIVVYDVKEEKTFINVEHWLEEINFNAPHAATLIVGNKEDGSTQATWQRCSLQPSPASINQALALAEVHGCRLATVSALTGAGVAAAFTLLTRDMMVNSNEAVGTEVKKFVRGVKRTLGDPRERRRKATKSEESDGSEEEIVDHDSFHPWFASWLPLPRAGSAVANALERDIKGVGHVSLVTFT